MSGPLTEKDLAAIEERLASASDGAWYKEPAGVCGPAGQTFRVLPIQFTDRGGMNRGNAEFVVAAREYVPQLVEALREHWRQAAIEGEGIAILHHDLYTLTVERDNLRKMLEDANQREQIQLQKLQPLAGVHLAAVQAMRLREGYSQIKRGAEEGEVEYWERRSEAWEAVRAADLVLKEAVAKVQVPA